MDWQFLIDSDKQLLLWFNGSQSLYLDAVVRTLTHAWTWVPLYLSLFYLVLKNNDSVKRIFLILVAAGFCVVMAGTIDDEIVKPLVARWRPTHDPQIGLLVDIVDGYRGGRYGFFSAHASNTFSITVFFWWLIRSRLLTTSMTIWSLTNCWTRMYLGVHFPGDILVGLCWGAISGSIVYWLYRLAVKHIDKHAKTYYTSSHCTSRGYVLSDINIPVSVLVFSLLYALFKGAFA